MPRDDTALAYLTVGNLTTWVYQEPDGAMSVEIFSLADYRTAPFALEIVFDGKTILNWAPEVDPDAVGLVRTLNPPTAEQTSCPHGCLTTVRRTRGLRRLLRRHR
ncbi:hypothetical protein Ga0074812_14940 [Parafrankia irregularis]|uniref:Uncharacterized protein n=1 Tax=Parafrankia irregularis TaxID=795642 RepID=A0A0S4QZ35_9ACTN|nr:MULTISPECIES: hypothetical protein [Frankiaceae]KPM50319.1 hypothetical protein ACG83_41000 [Frankia sp. R43]MBE3204700.1 hypothetical protein [Parafrankia sp. CH37]CUU60896.1 hypothetical protein Ga0074812_14940 [Parafrankia irregularis]